MPPTPSKSLLASKKGPLPIWAWGLGVLGLAYAYSRYKANKTSSASTASTAGTGTAGEPATGAPQYIIENNLPPTPSAPITVTAPPPVVTPPGTAPKPPTNQPPIQSGPAINQGGTAANPVTAKPTPPPPPVTAPAPPGRPASKPPHTVVSGDSYSKIAAEAGVKASGSTPAWQVLYNYNIGPSSPHSASARAELQKQGANLIYPGQTIYIPPQ